MDERQQDRTPALRQQAPQQMLTGRNSTGVRVVDLPTSEITARLTAPPMTAAAIASQARVFLRALWFDPNLSADDIRVFEGHYVAALMDVPQWAALKAFTSFSGNPDQKRLPRPGEIRAAAFREMATLRLESKSRQRAALPAPEKPCVNEEQRRKVAAMVASLHRHVRV